jgi:hypothetical protein
VVYGKSIDKGFWLYRDCSKSSILQFWPFEFHLLRPSKHEKAVRIERLPLPRPHLSGKPQGFKREYFSKKEVIKMSKFDDMEIISVYTLDQAIDDGVLVKLYDVRWLGKILPVVATSHLYNESSIDELQKIWEEFVSWKSHIEQTLPEEDRMFVTHLNDGQKIWVVEDDAAYTIMFPEDY